MAVRRAGATRPGWIGSVAEVRESFYAISAERRLHNPAVLAILDAAFLCTQMSAHAD